MKENDIEDKGYCSVFCFLYERKAKTKNIRVREMIRVFD
jgi:hypothetical protein